MEADDRETSMLVRGLVDELAEADSRMRQGLSSDIMERFAMAVRMMRSLSDMEEFATSVRTLRRLKGHLMASTGRHTTSGTARASASTDLVAAKKSRLASGRWRVQPGRFVSAAPATAPPAFGHGSRTEGTCPAATPSANASATQGPGGCRCL